METLVMVSTTLSGKVVHLGRKQHGNSCYGKYDTVWYGRSPRTSTYLIILLSYMKFSKDLHFNDI